MAHLLRQVIAGLRAGWSFVSNGPILEFSVNGQQIGDTIKLKDAGEVAVKASACPQFPLDRVEVLLQWQVVPPVRRRRIHKRPFW